MAIPKKEKGYGNTLAFILSLIFLIIIAVSIFILNKERTDIRSLNFITATEIIVLILAAQRLTRLFVYDSISQFIRDLFLDKKEVLDKETDTIYVERTKPKDGIRRMFADLLSCPWCTGIWVSTFTVLIYMMWRETWFLWLVLAIAGASSILQLQTNKIGWQAEKTKNKVLRQEAKKEQKTKDNK